MSLYDKSSLIQVPSLYKDGTLVSTIPEDRSGDFTVARGSNLAATRIGEDGYIKKGYENLLTYSNTFSDTAWIWSGTSVTSGQTDRDGGSDAYLVTRSSGGGLIGRQLISLSGVYTFSIYVKINASNGIGLSFAGTSEIAHFNISDENQTSAGAVIGLISASQEYVGNNFYRLSITGNTTTSNVRLYMSNAAGTSSDSGGGSHIIQDAMLNQGLVAYPYLETTTAPVQGGLLENTPRLDWSNSVPAVQLEEQRTNSVTQSEYLTGQKSVITYNNQISPEGLENALKQTGDGSVPYFYIDTRPTLPSSGTYNVSIFVKKGTTDWFRIRVRDLDTFYYANFNITSKVIGQHNSTTTPQIVDYPNDWKRISMTFETTTDLSAQFNIAPMDGDEDEAFPDTSLEYAYFYGLQCEKGSYSSSYIPTYGTSQTRSNEVISDNFNIPTTATIYNSFYSDTAETVFVLDQVFNVAKGLNKVAIAFSPTAVKISVGGSIVANATGTYDTTALSNIQLGSNNGTDYSNAPISGFYVFPEFLTDEELNSLTD